MHKERIFLCGLACLLSSLTAVQAQDPHEHEFPKLHIETVNGELPTYDIIPTPEGCWGSAITNNKKVPGRMVMTIGTDTLYDSGEFVRSESGVRIKIRGNSTAMFEQKPYLLKLSKKADLLLRADKAYKHKN